MNYDSSTSLTTGLGFILKQIKFAKKILKRRMGEIVKRKINAVPPVRHISGSFKYFCKSRKIGTISDFMQYNKEFKRTVIISLLFIVITTNMFSQEKGFKAGIMFGAVASQVDGDMLMGYNKGGLQTGIFLTNKLNKTNGFSIEMKFIQKGSFVNHQDSINPANNRYYKLRLNYVEVPFLYNLYLKKKFMLEVGAGFAYLISSREDKDGNGSMPPDPEFKKFDFPFVFGVCYFPWEKFHLDFRYSYSMVAIRDHPAHQTFYFNRGQYNNLLSFGMYLML